MDEKRTELTKDMRNEDSISIDRFNPYKRFKSNTGFGSTRSGGHISTVL